MSVVKKLAALAATTALSVSLVACGGSPGSGANANGGGDTEKSLAAQAQYNPQPYDNLKDGGTLTTALIEISTQWNPLQGDATLYSQTLWN
jgi:peptide/nickel transport system substrate-binding protein